MTQREQVALRELARGRVVLELGAWKGQGTAQLCGVAQEVWSVDWHLGDAHVGWQDTLPAYLAATRPYREHFRLVTVIGSFDQVLPRLQEVGWDLILLDGAHDRRQVDADLAALEADPGRQDSASY